MTGVEPWRWTVREAAGQLRGGRITRSEYLTALDRRAAERTDLNAFIRRFPTADSHVDAGDGPLAGIPVSVKDNIDTAGAPTTAGTGALQGAVPATDAGVISRIRAASGLLAGKNVMHELSLGITSNNAITGPARNPYDPELIPGGSSGGTAVAVAAGMTPAGLGADTGGSVRLPAALCGIVGFRPTLGRYPGGGVVPLSGSRDVVGPMARSVADVRLLDAVLAGTNPSTVDSIVLRGARIGVPRDVFRTDLDPEVHGVTDRVLDTLSDAGAELVEVDIAEIVERADGAGTPIVLHELRRDLSEYLAESGYSVSFDDVRRGIRSPDVREMIGPDSYVDISVELYRWAMAERAQAWQDHRQLLESHDLRALVQPTSPLPARPIGQDTTVELNGRRVPTFDTYVRHTNLAGVLDLPSISLPAGRTSAGLPLGIELNTATGGDETVLALAAAIEPHLPPIPPPTALPRTQDGADGESILPENGSARHQ